MVDVLNDADGMKRLLAFGVRNLPVVAKGESFVFGQDLEEVAEFVGLMGTGHAPLPPEALIHKWVIALRAAQRLVRQLPSESLNERVIDNRDRAIRLLAHHVFRIAEAFLETVVDGAEFSNTTANIPPKDGTFTTGEEIAAYGETVIARLNQWWEGITDRNCESTVKTYFGEQKLHMVFERCAWHSAQHTRQLAAVLERFGIAPDAPLTQADLAGLPVPERLWE